MVVYPGGQNLDVFLFFAGLFLDESVESSNVGENMLGPLFVHLYFVTESLLLLFHQFLQVRCLNVHAELDLLVKKLMTLVLWRELQLFQVREKRLFDLKQSGASIDLSN